MALAIFALLAALLLACANGANDIFKGVATLLGSGVADYRRALYWAVVLTLLGSLAAVLLGGKLARRFSGQGLVSESLAGEVAFAVAIGSSAAVTVFIASRLGFPVSTTHALVGAMVGVGYAAESGLNWSVLTHSFLAPLLLSPVVAAAGTALFYLLVYRGQSHFGAIQQWCLCVGRRWVARQPISSSCMVIVTEEQLAATLDTTESCKQQFTGQVFQLRLSRLWDGLHYVSAGLVCTTRALNDTPKLAALLLLLPWLGWNQAILICGVCMVMGGLVGGWPVADTMSRRITSMDPVPACLANLVSAVLLVAACNWGLPVSTTHVSCGALFGLGLATGKARWEQIVIILLSWVAIFPAAGFLGWLSYRLVSLLNSF
jgi:PiT family inorganic phosphate transporter